MGVPGCSGRFWEGGVPGDSEGFRGFRGVSGGGGSGGSGWVSGFTDTPCLQL